jgi:hypothetical protein
LDAAANLTFYIRVIQVLKLLNSSMSKQQTKSLSIIKSGPLLSDLSSAASSLGAMLAGNKLKKKKKNRKRKARAASGINGATLQTSFTTAPTSIGSVVRSSRIAHTPVVITGNCYSGYLRSDGGGLLNVYNANDALMLTNGYNVDILGSGTAVTSGALFPTVIRNIAASFLRWRLRKCILRYVPSCSSATAGNIAFCSVPETSIVAIGSSLGIVLTAANSTSASVWTPTQLDLVAQGGLRKDWCFVDSASIGTQSEERQESCGIINFAAVALPATTTLGILMLDFAVEFDGLSSENAYQLPGPPPAIPTLSSSIASSSKTLLQPVLSNTSTGSDFEQVPRNSEKKVDA